MSTQAVLGHAKGERRKLPSAKTGDIMIIGGTGVMGRRLVKHLAAHSELSVTVTSRSRQRAELLARSISDTHPDSKIRGVELDTSHAPDQFFCDCRPFLVIDASGPFQSSNYAIPIAALRAGAHCLDLADARDYLAGFGAHREMHILNHAGIPAADVIRIATINDDSPVF